MLNVVRPSVVMPFGIHGRIRDLGTWLCDSCQGSSYWSYEFAVSFLHTQSIMLAKINYFLQVLPIHPVDFQLLLVHHNNCVHSISKTLELLHPHHATLHLVHDVRLHHSEHQPTEACWKLLNEALHIFW